MIYFLSQCSVQRTQFDLLEALFLLKDVWKFVSMKLGAPSVTIAGQLMMQMLFVDSLDT